MNFNKRDAHLLINGRELLTMAAPRCVEFNENILLLVIGDFVEIRADEDLDWVLVPILGQVLREQVPLQFAFYEGGDEIQNVLGSDLRIIGLVLGHILFELDDSHSWHVILLQTEKLQDAIVIGLVAVDCHEQHLRGYFEVLYRILRK